MSESIPVTPATSGTTQSCATAIDNYEEFDQDKFDNGSAMLSRGIRYLYTCVAGRNTPCSKHDSKIIFKK